MLYECFVVLVRCLANETMGFEMCVPYRVLTMRVDMMRIWDVEGCFCTTKILYFAESMFCKDG